MCVKEMNELMNDIQNAGRASNMRGMKEEQILRMHIKRMGNECAVRMCMCKRMNVLCFIAVHNLSFTACVISATGMDKNMNYKRKGKLSPSCTHRINA